MPLCGNLSRNELTRNLSGNIWPQSSQLAEPLWTEFGIQSGINVSELISRLKKTKQKRLGWGMNGRTFSPNFCKGGKSHHHLIDGSRYRMVDYRPEVAKEPPPPPPKSFAVQINPFSPATLRAAQLSKPEGLFTDSSVRRLLHSVGHQSAGSASPKVHVVI